MLLKEQTLKAAKFLKRLRYKIVARGAKQGRGELDLVAVDGRTVVFVEVKTRRSDRRGTAAEAVDAAKQERLSRLALAYLKRNGLLECSARFDVIAVTWPNGAKKPTIQHIQNAFEVSGRGQMFS